MLCGRHREAAELPFLDEVEGYLKRNRELLEASQKDAAGSASATAGAGSASAATAVDSPVVEAADADAEASSKLDADAPPVHPAGSTYA